MKLLPEQFTSGGFLHTQLDRQGTLAIYRRSKGSHKHYEVIDIKSHNGYTIAGRFIEPAETYPSAEEWGQRGWTCDSWERADEKLKELQDKPKRKKK